MKKLRDAAVRPLGAGLLLWVVVAGLLTAFYIDQRMRDRELPVHPYIEATPAVQQKLTDHPVASPNRLFILFIDMMRYEATTDPALMPTLNMLKADSTWGRVTPCKSNMTVHCVEATLSGFDRSSLLSFAEDFHPGRSAHAGVWPHMLSRHGYRFKAVANYVIHRLYGDALADMHFYKRGDAGIDAHSLADVALDYFREQDTDVVLLYLIDAHDAGHQYGAAGDEYEAALRTSDEVLARLLEERRPEDTILVYGDHGCNENGQHNYSQQAPTFYLYNGPEVAKNHRQDIHIFSHKFFLNVLFRLPFTDSYQGETYFDVFPERVRSLYGAPESLELKRSGQGAQFELTLPDYVMVCFMLLGSLLAWLALFSQVPFRGWLVVSLAGCLFLKAWGYEAWDGLVHDSRLIPWLALYGVYFLAGYFFCRKLSGSDGTRGERVMSGATAMALALPVLHYPTLYGFGALRGVPVAILLLLAGAVCVYASQTRAAAGTRRDLALFAVVLVAVAFVASQYAIFVENFRIVYFYAFRPEDTSWYVTGAALVSLLAALAAAAVATGAFRPLDARAAGRAALAAALLLVFLRAVPVPPVLQAVVSIAAVVLAVVRCFVVLPFVDRYILFLLLELGMFFTYEFNYAVLFQLNGFIAVAGLFTSLASVGEGRRWFSGGVMVAMLALMGMMISFGFRTIGIDFKFASLWFGHHYIRLWFLVFLVTFLKYSAPLVLMLLAMRPQAGRASAVGLKILAGMASLLIPYAAFLYLQQPNFALLVDTVEELVYFIAATVSLLCAELISRRVCGVDEEVG